MKFLSLTTKKKVYLMAVGGLLVLVFLAIVVLAPSIRQTKRLHVDFVRAKEEVKNLITVGSTANLLEKQLNAYQKDLHKLNEGILEFGNEVEFIEFLEKLAKRDGVKQTLQVTQPAVTAESAYTTSTVSFKLEGTFEQVLSFWMDLEKSPYYVNIASFTISAAITPSDERVAEEPLLIANLSGVVFWHNGAL